MGLILVFFLFFEASAGLSVWKATATGYSGPFRTLNVERLLFSPLRGLTVVRRSAVLNGILQGSALNATSLMLPKPNILLLQLESLGCF